MLTGPIDVTELVLRKAGMKISDIDLIELNEAFAAVVLRFMQAFDLDDSKINVNGGAIAMGHPLGATGAMILGTALDELERTNKSTALITLCIGAGMGTATIIECDEARLLRGGWGEARRTCKVQPKRASAADLEQRVREACNELVNFKVDVDADGSRYHLGQPGASMNVFTLEVTNEIGQIIEKVATDPAIKGRW
jgi:hypothetical protein